MKLLLVAAVIELLNPELQFSVNRFVTDDLARLRLAVVLQAVQGACAFLGLVWFFSALSAGGFDQDAFFAQALLQNPAATRDWMAGGAANLGTLGTGGAFALVELLVLPSFWMVARRWLR